MATHPLTGPHVQPRVALLAEVRATFALRRRRALAEGLELAVERAGRRRSPLSSIVTVPAEVRTEAGRELLAIAERLRGPDAVDPEGLRRARRLVCDGSGPLYVPVAPGALRREAVAVLDALR